MSKSTNALLSNAPSIVVAGLLIYGAYKLGIFGGKSTFLCKTLGLNCPDDGSEIPDLGKYPLPHNIPGWITNDLDNIVDKKIYSNTYGLPIRKTPSPAGEWAVSNTFTKGQYMGYVFSAIKGLYDDDPWLMVTSTINGKTIGYVPYKYVILK